MQAPILTGNWYQWGPLNIVFNYVTIYLLFFGALQFQGGVGRWYCSKRKQSANSVYGQELPARLPGVAGYPAGPMTGGGGDAAAAGGGGAEGPPGLIHPRQQV